MNKFEQRRKNSLERAKKMIEENDGILINEELRNDKKVHLYIKCKRDHYFWTTVYKLNETDYDWCQKCYIYERAEHTRKETYKSTEEYLKKQKAILVEKTYDYEKQKFHVYCDKHHGYWNEVGYEATRIVREKLHCPVCKNIKKQKEKTQQQEEERKRKEELREERRLERKKIAEDKKIRVIQEQREFKRRKEEEKQRLLNLPPAPSNLDSFTYYAQYEQMFLKYNSSKNAITLQRAREKLNNLNCLNMEAISINEIKYNCNRCGEEYKKNKNEIMTKTFSSCAICNKKEALEKSHKSRMKREYQEMCEAAKIQKITILSEELIKAEEGIKCKNSKGKVFTITYRQFKCRKIMDPDYKKGGTSIPEMLCRIIIEQLTGKSFPKGYPEGWLYPVKNQSPRTYSVDMYNKTDFDMPIAFEYWGEEVHINLKKTSTKYRAEKLKRTQENDKKKAQYAKETNTKLIIITGYDHYVPLGKMINEIKDILTENKIPFNENAKINITTEMLYNSDYLQKVKEYSKKHTPHDGTLISDFIPSVTAPIKILCNHHNDSFYTSPLKLLYSNHWNCKKCIKEAIHAKIGINPDKIESKLSNIAYPYKISFIRFLEEPSSHALSEWNCACHGVFPKRIDSVIYKNSGRYHACPECEKIMYPRNKK